MPLDPERQKLCDDIGFGIADERDAVEFYKKMEDKLNKSDNPAVRALGLSVWATGQDEAKHKATLEHIKRLLCPTF